jgi:hypothetical protein
MPTTILLLHVHILTARPSFVTGDDWSQSNWRRTGMGTSSVSNGIAALYWSKSMPWIQKKAVNAMSTIILLLHVHIWHLSHHLSLAMIGVKVTEEGQVWVPAAVCQVIKLVYIDHSPCLLFRKRPWMQCPQLFYSCMHIFDTEATICHWLVMNQVNVTLEGQLWIPTVCQII